MERPKCSSFAALVVLSVIGIACQSQPTAVPTLEPRVGVVAQAPEILDNASVRLRLDHPGQPHPVDRTTLYVTRQTEIFVRDDAGRLEPVGIEEVTVGASIRFWITDVEFRSYPVQQYATRIEVDR
jgi:hypothetical protein